MEYEYLIYNGVKYSRPKGSRLPWKDPLGNIFDFSLKKPKLIKKVSNYTQELLNLIRKALAESMEIAESGSPAETMAILQKLAKKSGDLKRIDYYNLMALDNNTALGFVLGLATAPFGAPGLVVSMPAGTPAFVDDVNDLKENPNFSNGAHVVLDAVNMGAPFIKPLATWAKGTPAVWDDSLPWIFTAALGVGIEDDIKSLRHQDLFDPSTWNTKK